MLWVRVTNSATNQAICALALVDTGADDCVFPAAVASELGYHLKSGTRKEIGTAGGNTYAYTHICTVEVLEMRRDGTAGSRILYRLPGTPIDFAEGCDMFLLGSRSFLSDLILEIDYPRQIFSLRCPPGG